MDRPPTEGDGATRAGPLADDAPSTRAMETPLLGEEARLTARVAKAVSDAAGQTEALRAALGVLCAYTRWPYAEVWVPGDDGRLRRGPVFHTGETHLAEFAERSTAFSFGPGDGLTGTPWSAQAPVWLETLPGSVAPHPRAALAGAARLGAALVVPMASGRDTLAVLAFFMRTRTADDDRLVPLVALNAALLAPIISSKRTEDALRLAEERYRVLFGSNPVPMWVYDVETLQFLEVNDATVAAYGYTREEFLAMSIRDLQVLGDESPPGQIAGDDGAGLAPSGRPRHRKKNGSLIDVDVTTHTLLFAGRPARIVLAIDITERKRAQTALLESEERFRRLSAVASEGIVISANGSIIEVNEAACRMFSVQRDDVIGKPVLDFIAADARSRVSEVISADAERPYETVGVRGDGTRLDILVTTKRMQYMGHSAQVAAIRDLSERQEVDRLKNEFVSIVSHELRTPLTSIRGSLGLMEGGVAGALPSQAADLVRIARQNADRLIRLINDILDIEKIEAGKMELKTSLFDPKDVVATALNDTRGIAEASRVRVISRLGDVDRLTGDRDRIIQVVVNLVSNAIKFSPEGGVVTVSLLAGRPGFLRLAVDDRGPGLTREQIDKLFVKFQQLDGRDSRAKMGTGLGLAISRAIVEQHGGQIGVDSAPGRGSTFWFELPTLQSSGSRAAERTILSVEDDDDLSRLLNRMLSGHGFRVIHAGTLAEAELLAHEFVPDAVLLDVRLPDGSGLDLLTRMRSDRRLREVPVVVLSGSPRDARVADARLVEWLTKPCELTEVLRAVRRAVRPPGPPRALLVEDDDTVRGVMAAHLAALGIACVEARDGAQALTLARGSAPDLIVLDVGVPRIDGYALVDRLRREVASATPLLVYTAHELTSAQRDALTLGATRHLTKGRSFGAEFEAAVRELLDGVLGGRLPQAPHGAPAR